MTRPTLKPPPRYKPSEWAERFRYLSRDYTSQHGRYALKTVPYARAPMDDAIDRDVQEIILMWASQLTKTTVGENVIGYHIHGDPCPILMVQPTVEMAQAWSKERLAPTIRDTPVLRELVSSEKSRDAGNTIQSKSFPGGNMAIVGANAPAGLAARARRVVFLDEIDRFPVSAGTEGDPCALAVRRTESFWNSVIIKTSTPTVKGFSRIEAEFEQTDKRHWYCPCAKCGEFQTLKWGQVKWPEDKPEEAWLECVACGAHLSDAERIKMIRAGEWRPTAKFTGKRGYFLNGIASPFKAKKGFRNRLHQMAAQAIEAKAGGVQTLKTWVNTFLAETWDDPSERLEAHVIQGRAEEYGPDKLPDKIKVLRAATDVQKDRLETEVVGWAEDDESWGVELVKFFGNPEHDEVWQSLAEFMAKRYKREDGVELKISGIVIDTGHLPKRVRAFAATCGMPRVWLVRGANTEQSVLVSVRYDKHYRQHTFSVSTVLAKDTIFSRLRNEDPGPRYMHFPNGHGYDKAYYDQLTAEAVKTEYKRGFPKRVYEKIRERNEALDLRVYGLAALDMLPPNYTAVERNLKARMQPPPEPTKYVLQPTPPPPKPTPKRVRPFVTRPGFINGWK